MVSQHRWLQRNDSRLVEILERLEQDYGRREREPDLDLLQVLVLTVLSQNTTDQNSRRAYLNLLKEFPPPDIQPVKTNKLLDSFRVVDSARELPAPDWAQIVSVSPKKIQSIISPAGLQASKTETIMALLQRVIGKGEAIIEGRLDQLSAGEAIDRLTEVKGIGVKTAAVALMETGRKDICPVDTHVARITRRLKLVDYEGKNREIIFRRLQPLIPEGKAYNLHHNLLSFGREICTARSPDCEGCAFAYLCWDLRCRRGGEELLLKFS